MLEGLLLLVLHAFSLGCVLDSRVVTPARQTKHASTWIHTVCCGQRLRSS